MVVGWRDRAACRPRIAVKMNAKFPEDVTEWKEIDDKEERAENRTLRNTAGDWGKLGFVF